MKDLKITKGEWRVEPSFRKPEIHSSETVSALAVITQTFTTKTDSDGIKHSIGQSHNEMIANALLIAEVGTVANETGKTPRELYQSWCVTSAELSLKKSILISIKNQNKVLSENFEVAKAVIKDLNEKNKELREVLAESKAVLKMIRSNNLQFGLDSSKRHILRLDSEEWDLMEKALKS